MRLSVMKILIMYWVLVSKEIQHHSFMKSSTFLVCTSPNPGKPRWMDLAGPCWTWVYPGQPAGQDIPVYAGEVEFN